MGGSSRKAYLEYSVGALIGFIGPLVATRYLFCDGESELDNWVNAFLVNLVPLPTYGLSLGQVGMLGSMAGVWLNRRIRANRKSRLESLS